MSATSTSTKRDPAAAVRLTEQVFAALAHPSRRQILLTLQFRGGEMTAGEIAERFGCTWPTTSRHLKVLREAGLVTKVRKGREQVYSLQQDFLRSVLCEWLGWFSKKART
ncbi:MAG TPA: metalloregulator ArsR/SmtB family transcription factor [Reyranella sp.]|nr:metalloregulator ArsR/SmtB family transcription factor [Reyranella sp.]